MPCCIPTNPCFKPCCQDCYPSKYKYTITGDGDLSSTDQLGYITACYWKGLINVSSSTGSLTRQCKCNRPLPKVRFKFKLNLLGADPVEVIVSLPNHPGESVPFSVKGLPCTYTLMMSSGGGNHRHNHYILSKDVLI